MVCLSRFEHRASPKAERVFMARELLMLLWPFENFIRLQHLPDGRAQPVLGGVPEDQADAITIFGQPVVVP